jgi:hypothetical protein
MHHHNFFKRVEQFNSMYQMEATPKDSAGLMYMRLREFEAMLREELDEVIDISPLLAGGKLLDARVAVADWLGDIIVYCASEALRWEIPIEQVLEIIMDSNASKLQADGTAKFINGKLQKGPGYWKPEPKICALLKGVEDDARA